MVEGASLAEIAQSEGREDYRAHRAEAKSITEAKGTTTRVVKGVKFNEVNTLTPDMQSAAKRFEKYGYKIHVFIGSGETVDGKSARGFINDNDVYIQWDAVASPLKIALHEIVHSQKYEPILNRAQRRIIERMAQAKFDNIADTVYSAQYASITKDAEKYADELVCDVLSGLNTHGELVADIQSEFWNAFENDNLGYSASTYAVQQDAGGANLSASNIPLYSYSAKGLYLPKNEYAKVISSINTGYYEDYKTHKGLQYQSCVTDTTHNLYFYEDNGFNEYKIIARVSYEIEDMALIDQLIRSFRDEGTYANTKDLNSLLERYANWRGSDIVHNVATQNTGATVENGSVFEGTSESDRDGVSGLLGQNSEQNKIAEQESDDTQFSFGRKWKPSKTKAREFAQTMDEIDKFCSENGIDRSRSSDSYYFTIDGQKYRVSNHTIEASNAKATNDLGETVRRKYHENGREDEGELILYLETEDGTTARVPESQLSEWRKGQAMLKSRKAKGEKITAPAALKQRALQKLKERLHE